MTCLKPEGCSTGLLLHGQHAYGLPLLCVASCSCMGAQVGRRWLYVAVRRQRAAAGTTIAFVFLDKQMCMTFWWF